MNFVAHLKEEQDYSQLGQQFVEQLAQYLCNQEEQDFNNFCELLPLLPPIDRLVLPLHAAVRFYAGISSFYVENLQDFSHAAPIFIYALQLALEAGNTQKLRLQRQEAQELALNLLNAETADAFAYALFSVFQMAPSLSLVHLDNFLNGQTFPSQLSGQIFNYLITKHQQFAGEILTQVQVSQLDYKQFLNNPDNAQLRLVAVQNINDISIMDREFDGNYEVRVAFCQELSKCEELSPHERLEHLGIKTSDKNVYVRKAAFECIDRVIHCQRFKILDPQVLTALLQKTEEQDVDGAAELVPLIQEALKYCAALNNVLSTQLRRILQMQASELASFLQLYKTCIEYKNNVAEAQFKLVVLQLINNRLSEEEKELLTQFVTDFLLATANDDGERQQEDEDVIVAKPKSLAVEALMSKLIDIEQLVVDQNLVHELLDKLCRENKQLQAQITSSSLVSGIINAALNESDENINIPITARQLLSLVRPRQIVVTCLSSLVLRVVEMLENRQFGDQLDLMAELIYLIQLKQLYDQNDEVARGNMVNLRKYLINNHPILYENRRPLGSVAKIVFGFEKIYIDELFGKLSRGAKDVVEQTMYCFYCGELLEHLEVQLDQNSGLDSESQQDKKSLSDIYTTMQESQQDSTSFLQEYSYLIYAALISCQFLAQEEMITDTTLINMLIRSLTIFCMVLPKGVYIQSQEFNEMAISTFKQLTQALRVELLKDVRYKATVCGLIIHIQSLVFNKPSEFNSLMLECCRQLIGIDDSVDATLIQCISQLFNSSCVKIENYIKLLFGISATNALSRCFFQELDVRIIKQFYKELSQVATGDIKLIEGRVEGGPAGPRQGAEESVEGNG